jgi:hypothetical protein
LKRIAVKIRSERFGGDAPDALIVFLHGQRLCCAFDGDGHFLGVECAKAEDDTIVRMNLGRNDRGRGAKAGFAEFSPEPKRR